MIDNTALVNPPSPDLDAPLFAVLNRFEECEDILARNTVGRLAFALQDRVSVLPVHYVYEDGWIYGRTSAGGTRTPRPPVMERPTPRRPPAQPRPRPCQPV